LPLTGKQCEENFTKEIGSFCKDMLLRKKNEKNMSITDGKENATLFSAQQK
jgi:hypothetical protein